MLHHTMSPISGRIKDELVRAYSAPDRHYHNLAHIEAMLALMGEHAGVLSDPTSVEAAIWFHDVVYDTHRHDNEDRSAELAAERLAGLLSPDRIERIASMIRATADHVVPESFDEAVRRDCALFLDMDLGVLGGTPDEFATYEEAVRREYGWVPEALWTEGRRKVVAGFLARPAIYASPPFRASHEMAARENLTRSLEQLAQYP
jgi:predicted metal-dependent HD superfamily phosphohydrolase